MRFIYYVATAIFVFFSGCTGHQVGSKGKQPNIIFIMADDHATQALGCYGSRIIETTNIDKLAEEGMVFNQAFVTNSICAPSRGRGIIIIRDLSIMVPILHIMDMSLTS